LHVIDASDKNRLQRIRQVNNVLKQLDADKVPQIRVYNKIDKLKFKTNKVRSSHSSLKSVWLSALTGEGLKSILSVISDFISKNVILGRIKLTNRQGRQRAKLFQMGAVREEKILKDGSWELLLKIKKQDIHRFLKKESMKANVFVKIQ